MTRPNIVVFIPDQLRADALGCFGNAAASTPAIDELAARGVRFENAFGQQGASPRRGVQRGRLPAVRPRRP